MHTEYQGQRLHAKDFLAITRSMRINHTITEAAKHGDSEDAQRIHSEDDRNREIECGHGVLKYLVPCDSCEYRIWQSEAAKHHISSVYGRQLDAILPEFQTWC